MSRYNRARKRGGRNIEGRRAVLEALRGGMSAEKILLSNDVVRSQQIDEILKLSKDANVKIERIAGREMDRISTTKKAQGVIGIFPEREYASLEDMVLLADSRKEKPLICLLDGIQDPQNLGAIARTLEVAGGHGLVIPDRRASGITPGAVRASAGAIEHLLVAKVHNMRKSVDLLAMLGLKIIGLTSEGGMNYAKAPMDCPLALVIGGEMEGLSRGVRDSCDLLVTIPQHGKVASLNASAAAAIVIFASVQQRTDDNDNDT